MRQIWIREVRHYKYIMLLCCVTFVIGLFLLHEYHQQEHNIGTIINVMFIQNVSYTVPIYKVRINNIIYNVYDNCIIHNISSCNHKKITFNEVYIERINGMYIVTSRNHFLLYFSVFIITLGIGILLITSYAYLEFFRFRNNEYKSWSKQKKYDLDNLESSTSIFFD